MRARLNVAGHDDFIVKVPNRAEDKGVSEGMNVKVGWATKDCRALDYMEGSAH